MPYSDNAAMLFVGCRSGFSRDAPASQQKDLNTKLTKHTKKRFKRFSSCAS
jgi:hypothetical protein